MGTVIVNHTVLINFTQNYTEIGTRVVNIYAYYPVHEFLIAIGIALLILDIILFVYADKINGHLRRVWSPDSKRKKNIEVLQTPCEDNEGT